MPLKLVRVGAGAAIDATLVRAIRIDGDQVTVYFPGTASVTFTDAGEWAELVRLLPTVADLLTDRLAPGVTNRPQETVPHDRQAASG